MLPETCWAIKIHWNNKFYYMVASCWFFLWVLYYNAWIHEHQVHSTSLSFTWCRLNTWRYTTKCQYSHGITWTAIEAVQSGTQNLSFTHNTGPCPYSMPIPVTNSFPPSELLKLQCICMWKNHIPYFKVTVPGNLLFSMFFLISYTVFSMRDCTYFWCRLLGWWFLDGCSTAVIAYQCLLQSLQ